MKTKTNPYAEERARLLKSARGIVDAAKASNRDFTKTEDDSVNAYLARVDEIDAWTKAADESDGLMDRIANLGGPYGGKGSVTNAKAWAVKAAGHIARTHEVTGTKAVVSGSLDVPAVMVESVQMASQATRLLELVTVKTIETNNYAFLRQTVRTNNAAPVADNALKPTSVFTFTEVEDRARVIAHLSEPFPQRYLTDHEEVVRLLELEMAAGVFAAIEDQVVNGDGTGENFTGILHTSGIQTVAYSNSIPETLRKARTKLETVGEIPTAWVAHPSDIEAMDLLREGGTTGDFLALDRVLGSLPVVPSTAVTAGTAILADWKQTRLYVREQGRLDIDAGGDLFTKNQMRMRAEQRANFAALRPMAIAKVTLTSA